MFGQKKYKDLKNIELAMDLAPTADDMWLNVMANKAGIKLTLLNNGLILPVANKDNETLSSVNVVRSQNDIQLKKEWGYFEL